MWKKTSELNRFGAHRVIPEEFETSFCNNLPRGLSNSSAEDDIEGFNW